MKIAYKIITPLLAVGAVAMGFLLKLFYFTIGGVSDELSSIVAIASQFGVKTQYEFSAFEIIQMLLGAESASEKGAEEFLKIAEPIIPHLIAFVVFLILALGMFLAVGVVSTIVKDRKKVIWMSVAGLVLCFICIVIGRLAFDKIIGGEIPLTDIVGMFSESQWAQLAAAVVTVKSATLSAGFFAVFGMYLLVIFWTIITNMLISTPIQHTRKHRRKKPLRRPSAMFRR